MDSLYLDAAATSKYKNTDDIIVATIAQSMQDSWLNPNSLYATGVKSKVQVCRKNIADFINAKPEEIIFTSCGSESNSLAIQGFVKQCILDGKKPFVITSCIEHKSVIECVDNLCNVEVAYIGVDKEGFIDMDKLKDTMLRKTQDGFSIFVSIQLANNEIGVIQDLKEIATWVHGFGGVLHTDAVQAFAHIPIDVEELDVDMMSVSAHKVSPVLRGIGFLYKKNCINIQPIIYGSQESGLRGGTTNTYQILGLNKALEYCDIGREKINNMCKLRDYLINHLEFELECKLNGSKDERLPNNVNVVLPDGVTGESALYMLSMSNIFVSTSSACNSHSIVPSYVLKSIGLSDEEAMRSIRITIPEDITYGYINDFLDELNKTIKIIKF